MTAPEAAMLIPAAGQRNAMLALVLKSGFILIDFTLHYLHVAGMMWPVRPAGSRTDRAFMHISGSVN